MNKKTIIGVIILIIAGAFYYFTQTANQIQQLHTEISQEIALLKQQGFKVEDHTYEKTKEHFILTFDDPQKIAAFFQTQGVKLTSHDAQNLKGLKVAIDLTYLPDRHHAYAMDLYPVALPEVLTQKSRDPEQQKIIDHLQDMLQRRAILMHLAINREKDGFEGSLKDINETFRGEEEAHLLMQGMVFSGDIKEQKVVAAKEHIKKIALDLVGTLHLTFANIRSRYQIQGKTPYDNTIDYRVDTIDLQDNRGLTLHADHLDAETLSQNHNGLLYTESNSTLEKLSLSYRNETITLKSIRFDAKADNLDIQALETLNATSSQNSKAIDKAVELLLSKAPLFEITNFSVDTITKDKQTMKGFDINASLAVKQSFNTTAAQQNPLLLLDKITAQLNVALSNDLFAAIAAQPQFVMVLMLFPPMESNGQKRYRLELKDGKLIVNGNPIL